MERLLRAEQLQTTFKRGWLLVTDQRLIFSEKDRLGAKEHWSVPLGKVESAVARDDLGFGMHKFVVHYRDERGRQQKHELTHLNVTKGFLLGPLSKIGPNPLLPLEQAVRDAISGSRSTPEERLQSARNTPTPARRATKRCPDCAEDVLAEARVCRFCGFRWT